MKFTIGKVNSSRLWKSIFNLFVDFKVKINKRCIPLDSNVVIDLILVTQKATGQFTDTLVATVIPINGDV
jgi:hypothetical protein